MGSLSTLPVLLLVVVSCCVIVVHPAPWRNYQVRQSQVCGDKLADMLSLICSGRGYNFAFKPEGANARRFRRGIVEECCRKSCTPALLELYCRADPTEPPSNVQIRKRSDSEPESLEHQSTEVTSSPTTTSPRPEATDTNTNSLDRKTTNGDSTTTAAKKESENSYKILNLLASSERSTQRHGTKGLGSKSTPNDTTDEDLFPNSHIPPLRHHKNHHHRRKFHSRKTTTKTKRDKNFHGGSTKTFEIGTVKPYFAGRAFASFRGSYALS